MFTSALPGAPGAVGQVRECAGRLVFFGKKAGGSVFLVGHVTKEGTIAGPRVLEHMVDTGLYFEGEKGHPYRILKAVKNRFGSTNEIGVFEMRATGRSEGAGPSGLFLAERAGGGVCRRRRRRRPCRFCARWRAVTRTRSFRRARPPSGRWGWGERSGRSRWRRAGRTKRTA